jgi:phenylpropionate dioxygenase-like ring-hydroxylating dioxygenase large terminal subunit
MSAIFRERGSIARAGEASDDALYLRDFWYLASPSRALRVGDMVGKTILGEPVLLLRNREGQVSAIRDICPHRGMPLRFGSFDGTQVSCCYHGWSFDTTGRCVRIPALAPEEGVDVSRIRVRHYAVREVQGCIWVFMPRAGRPQDEPMPEPPHMPGIPDASWPQVECELEYALGPDDTAYTLMDPGHIPYVHNWWWWKKDRTRVKEKRKDFEPAELGWRMRQHAAPSTNRMYRLFGRKVHTELTYRLPGMRIERIDGELGKAVSLLIMTPTDASSTAVYQCVWWTQRWLQPLRPLIRYLVHGFLDQDGKAAVLQRQGLAHDPPKMLLGDVDQQARWYFRLKREWNLALQEGRPFRNPIESCTLRWFS